MMNRIVKRDGKTWIQEQLTDFSLSDISSETIVAPKRPGNDARIIG
jgi:hypothetical protein